MIKLLSDTSEPIGSYTRIYKGHGIEACCLITNAAYLQKAWCEEKGLVKLKRQNLVLEQVKEFSPDVLIIEDIDFIDREWVNLVRSTVKKLKLVIGSHCAPYNSEMVNNFKNLDLLFTCTPGLKYDLEREGVNVYLIYHGFDPTILLKIDNENDEVKDKLVFSGSLFTGVGFHDKRIMFLENILKNDIDLVIYGNLEKGSKTIVKKILFFFFRILNLLKLGTIVEHFQFLKNYQDYGDTLVKGYSTRLKKAMRPPVFGIEMFRKLKESDIILNIHGEVAGEYAGNIRLFEATGVGSCLLTDRKKNINELFEPGKEIVVYDSPEDCISKIKWLLENEDERKIIAQNGQRRTLRNHTVENRCSEIIKIIRQELDKKS